MLEHHGPAAWKRAHALQRYIQALETGDGAALSAALRQAQDDSFLEQLILALQDVYLDAEETAIHPDEVAQAREMLRTQARARSNGHRQTGELHAETAILPRRQERERERRSQEMRMGDDIPEITPSGAREVSDGAESELHSSPVAQQRSENGIVATRGSRAVIFLQAIAAVLVVAVMVGSFYALFSSHLIHRGTGTDNSSHASISRTGVTLASGEGVVLVGSRDSDVLALRARDGALVWRYSTGTGYPITALATLDGVVYSNTENGDIAAVRIADGKVLWNRDFNQFEGFPDTMAIVDGVLLVPFPLGPVALRPSDGATLWRSVTDRFVGAGEGAVYVSADETGTPNAITASLTQMHRVKALRASDGKLLWSYTLRRSGEDAPTAYVANGVVYLATYYNANNTGAIAVTALRASDGTRIWTQEADNTVLPFYAPFYSDGSLLFAHVGERICAVRTDSGTTKWCTPTPGVGSAVTADGSSLYLCREEGESGKTSLGVGALKSQDGSQRWYWRSEPQRPIASGNNRYGVSIGGSAPSIAALDGAVYTGATMGVYAIRGSDGHQLWHTLDSEIVMALLAAKAG